MSWPSGMSTRDGGFLVTPKSQWSENTKQKFKVPSLMGSLGELTPSL